MYIYKQVASSDATQEMTETMDVYKSQVRICISCLCLYCHVCGAVRSHLRCLS